MLREEMLEVSWSGSALRRVEKLRAAEVEGCVEQDVQRISSLLEPVDVSKVSAYISGAATRAKDAGERSTNLPASPELLGHQFFSGETHVVVL